MYELIVVCWIFTIVGSAVVVGVNLITALVKLATAVVQFFRAT